MIRVAMRLPLSAFVLDVAVELDAPMTALFGPSGVGKTSFLEAIAGLRTPVDGEIQIDDDVLFSSSSGISVPPEARSIGYVPQDALLFPHLSVLRNLHYGVRKNVDAIPIDSVVDALEIGPLLDREPHTLSGGERQRVALGRALVSGPRLLLLDEPLAALDAGLKDRILPYLKRVRDRYGIPAIVVSHDVAEAIALCDDVVVLEQGRVALRGPPRTVLVRPGTFFQDRFENIFEVSVTDQEPEEGITRVRTERGLELAIPHRPSPSSTSPMLVGLFAEDVLLARVRPAGISARNVLEGVVESMEESEGVVMLRVTTPEAIYVKLTRRARSQLGVEVGTPVHLIVKTHSIHTLG